MLMITTRGTARHYWTLVPIYIYAYIISERGNDDDGSRRRGSIWI